MHRSLNLALSALAAALLAYTAVADSAPAAKKRWPLPI